MAVNLSLLTKLAGSVVKDTAEPIAGAFETNMKQTTIRQKQDQDFALASKKMDAEHSWVSVNNVLRSVETIVDSFSSISTVLNERQKQIDTRDAAEKAHAFATEKQRAESLATLKKLENNWQLAKDDIARQNKEFDGLITILKDCQQAFSEQIRNESLPPEEKKLAYDGLANVINGLDVVVKYRESIQSTHPQA